MSSPSQLAYGHTAATTLSFDDAVRVTKNALADAGFGVLSEIDVSKTLKEKLGAEHPRTLILGACNPSFADRALVAEPGVSLLLPCNVVIRQAEGGVEVSAIDARAMMRHIGNPALEEVAAEVDERLRSVIAAIGDGG
jgi:uncharacterized protein (DUF302 family)